MSSSHSQSSSRNQEDTTSDTRKRRRSVSAVKRACLNCKESHQACEEGVRPCKRCVQLGLAHLCFDPPERKRGRPRKRIYQLSAVQASLLLGGNGPTQDPTAASLSTTSMVVPSAQLTALATMFSNSSSNALSVNNINNSSSNNNNLPAQSSSSLATVIPRISFSSSSSSSSSSSCSADTPTAGLFEISPKSESTNTDYFSIETCAFSDSAPTPLDKDTTIISTNSPSSSSSITSPITTTTTTTIPTTTTGSWVSLSSFDTVKLNPKRVSEDKNDDEISNHHQYRNIIKALTAENRNLRLEADMLRQELAQLRHGQQQHQHPHYNNGNGTPSKSESGEPTSSPPLAVWDGHTMPFRLSAYNDTFRCLFSSFSLFELQEVSWDKLVHPKMIEATQRCWQWVCNNHITYSQQRHVVFKQKDGRNVYTTVDLLFTYPKDGIFPITIVTNIHPITKCRYLEYMSNRPNTSSNSVTINANTNATTTTTISFEDSSNYENNSSINNNHLFDGIVSSATFIPSPMDSSTLFSSIFDMNHGMNSNENLEDVLNRLLSNMPRATSPTVSFKEEW